MTILLSDPRVAAVPVHECGEPLVRLPLDLGPARAWVRHSLAARLIAAQGDLIERFPALRLRVVEGHRSVADQEWIVAAYAAEVLNHRPELAEPAHRTELEQLVSRFVSPAAVAPHVAGAAVDLTLVDVTGAELDLGTPIDATPEVSGGRCFTASPDISDDARAHRDLLAAVLGGQGLVNYPTEWWHWSHGDRYWALVTGAPAALYGPADAGLTGETAA
ncbi:M15 family metallopeptidase [Nocardioides acrostichi]|uniref:Dipeptidase n=1 Tax=Nocardioides acrostichi TaxID=2784339 RepID=A0A930V0Q2_9ACTN|nr:M15 family metallopeptidase [Nocardioides acrostichi]MBF4161104.1 dipeptidase [Nocardioides acrostichi]